MINHSGAGNPPAPYARRIDTAGLTPESYVYDPRAAAAAQLQAQAPPPPPVQAPPPAQIAPPHASDDLPEVIFSRPYQAHGEMVSRITMRRPVTREIKVAGTPFKITLGQDGTVVDTDRRWPAIVKYIELLASPPLPPSTIDNLEFSDLAACAAVIENFFLEAMMR